MSTLETQYRNYLKENPESAFTFEEWSDWKFSNMELPPPHNGLRPIDEHAEELSDWDVTLMDGLENEPYVSDDFQIGPDGAYEHIEDSVSIIDEAYENYENAYYKGQAFGYKKLNDNEFSPDLKILKEEFINKCKTDSEFSQKWGLKIEERELSLEERREIFEETPAGRFKDISWHNMSNEETIEYLENIPTKLITITYNNETIESYE